VSKSTTQQYKRGGKPNTAMELSGTPSDENVKPFHNPWDGPSKIVVGIDIGTTQSGVAFAFFETGEFGR
jgi:hypothetical protein